MTSISDILHKYKNKRIEHVNTLKTGGIPLIVHDTYCRNALGKRHVHTQYSCPSCKDISTLTNLYPKPTGEKDNYYGPVTDKIREVPIEHGKYSGKILVVVPHGRVGIRGQWSKQANYITQAIIDNNPSLATCNTRIDGASRYYESDSFINQLLVYSVMEQQLSDSSEHVHLVRHFNDFICRGFGYTFQEQVHPLTDIDPNINNVRSILLQLGTYLSSVRDLSFIHGDATIDSLYYTKSKCKYKSNDDIDINHKLTLKFGKYEKSSILISNSTRLIPRTNVDIEMSVSNFRPEVEVRTRYNSSLAPTCIRRTSLSDDVQSSSENPFQYKSDNGVDCYSDQWYRIKTNNNVFFNVLRYSGVPLFGGSYDLYTFLVSLMTWKEFRDIVLSNDQMITIWRSVWLPEDVKTIEDRLKKYTDPVTSVFAVSDIMRGIWLQCHAIESYVHSIISSS